MEIKCYLTPKIRNILEILLPESLVDLRKKNLTVLSSFKLWISLGFVTSCYVIMILSQWA